MRKFLSFLATLSAILFVITLPIVLLAVNVEHSLFNADTYKDALSQSAIYESLPPLIGEAIVEVENYDPCAENPVACGAEGQSNELQQCLEKALGDVYFELASNQRQPTPDELALAQPCFDDYGIPQRPENPDKGMPPFLKNLTPRDWEVVIRALLPPDSMQHLTEQALDEIFAYLNGQQDEAILPLGELRDRLVGPAGEEAIWQILKAQPDCAPGETQLLEDALRGSGDPMYCNPAEDDIQRITPAIRVQLQSVAAEISDEVMMIEAVPAADDPRPGLQFVRMLFKLALILPLGLLLLITIFAVRSAKSWFKWWGIPLIIGGALTFLLRLATPLLYGFAVLQASRNAPPSMSASLVARLFDFGRGLLENLMGRVALQGLILGIIGAVLVIATLFIREQSTQENG